MQKNTQEAVNVDFCRIKHVVLCVDRGIEQVDVSLEKAMISEKPQDFHEVHGFPFVAEISVKLDEDGKPNSADVKEEGFSGLRAVKDRF